MSILSKGETGQSRFALLTATAVTLLLIVSSVAARAAPEGKLAEPMQFSLGPGIGTHLSVISTNGQSYDRFKPGSSINLGGDVKIKMKRGKIDTFGIYWGPCNDNDCNKFFGNALLYGEDHSQSELVQKTINFELHSEMIPAWDGGLNPLPLAAGIISACNERLAMVGDTRRAYDIFETVPMTLGVDTYVGIDFFNPPPQASDGTGVPRPDDIDQAKTIDVTLPIRCEPVQLTPDAPDGVAGVLPDMELVAADLGMRIDQPFPAHNVTYAGSCPVGLTLDVGVTTNIKGKVDGYIEHKDVAGNNWVSQPFTMTTQATDGALWKQVWSDLISLPLKPAVASNSSGGVVNQQAGNGLQFNPGGGSSGGGLNPATSVVAGNSESAAGHHVGFFRFTAYTGKQVLPIGPGGSNIVSFEQFKQTPWRKYDVTCEPKKAVVGTAIPGDLVIPVPPPREIVKPVTLVAPAVTRAEPKAPVRVTLPTAQPKVRQVLPLPKVKQKQIIALPKASLKKAEPQRVNKAAPVRVKKVAPTRVKSFAPVPMTPQVQRKILCIGGVVRAQQCYCPRAKQLRGGRCVTAGKKSFLRKN